MRDRATQRSFLAASVICIAALVVRYPSAFRLPQFYAEEGRFFFADAYNEGWASLFATANGYFHLLPRLIANLTISLGVPYAVIPAVFVYACLPFYALLWARIHSRLDIPLPARFFLCLATVLVPVGTEVFMSQTNIQWVLAPVPLVLYLGRLPRSRLEKSVDGVFLTLCFFTGPYSLLWAPLIAAHARITRRFAERRMLVYCGGMAAAATAVSLARFGTLDRVEGPSELSLLGLVQLMTRTFALPVLTRGVEGLAPTAVILTALLAVAALFVFGRAVARSRNGISLLFLIASLAVFASTLASYWRAPQLLSPYGFAMRTFYLPVLFLLWALIAASPWDRRAQGWWIAVFLWYAVQLPSFNTYSVWAEPQPDLRWSEYAARLEMGKGVVVPITPLGWDMRLDPRPTP